jgi:ferredoxin
MSLTITDDCINCSACVAECPNTAIYEGGVEWYLEDEAHDALATDTYYIVPEKCTECEGAYDSPQCVAVCPAECIIANGSDEEEEE